jgi:hypothetical protein
MTEYTSHLCHVHHLWNPIHSTNEPKGKQSSCYWNASKAWSLCFSWWADSIGLAFHTHSERTATTNSAFFKMPGILLNSFAAANRRSLTSSSSSSSSIRQPHRSSSSNLPIPYFPWSSSHTPSSSNESSLASTASSSAVNSPGAASRRKVYHSKPVAAFDDSSYSQPAPLTTLHHAVWYDSVTDTATVGPATCRRPGPPNRHKSASALLWGRELPHDSGMAWGQFVDFDQS